MIRIELEELHCSKRLKEQLCDNGSELEELHCDKGLDLKEQLF